MPDRATAPLTTIQMLAALRSQAMNRNEAVDLAEEKVNWREGTMLASRSWSRQEAGIADAILAEVPRDVPDAVSVLLILLERIEQELIMADSAPDRGPAAKAAEQAWIATANCVSALARSCPPKTNAEMVDVRRVDKLREMWLPGAVRVLAEGEAA